MTILTKTIVTAIGVWFLSLIVLFVFPGLLPVVSGFAIPLSLPIALFLLILTLIALIREKRKLVPLLCFALILMVSYIALRQIMYWGALAHLFMNKARFEGTAQRMLAAENDLERQNICGDKCRLISSDRGRVAFHYVHGFLNWHDLIYDPTRRVGAMKSWDERKQFDTYFISAEHLTGDWYLAYFAD